MPDKDIEAVKLDIAKEIRALMSKLKQDCGKAKPMLDECAQLAKKKDPSKDDKARTVDLRKALQDLDKSYLTQANSSSDRINKLLKTAVPGDSKSIPEWQKGMDKWYRDLLNKESGVSLGHGLRVTGDVSIKDKKATILINGKF